MIERNFQSRRGSLTDQQKQSVRQGQQWLEENRAELDRHAQQHKRELDILIQAIKTLKHERQTRALTLTQVAQRTGIDESDLAQLENDPYPNPTLSTILRIADAIGVRLTIGVTDKAA